MKKIILIVVTLILLIAGGLYWYFQIHKKSIIKEKIQQTILNKTDSLYHLSYDSSMVDELTGDASFLKLKLKIDSAILKKFQAENKAPDVIVDLEVDALHIRGLGSVALLSEDFVDAKTIRIENPVLKFVRISVTKKDKEEVETAVDTTEIYARLLGKFKLIKADSIHITNGSITWNDEVKQTKINMEKFDVQIHHFLIDSMHRYLNLAAYFLKDATLKASQFSVVDKTHNKKYSIANIDYNANTGRVSIRDINLDDDQRIKEISIAGINTYEFIYNNVIKCRSLRLHDLDLSLKKIKKTGKPADSLAINIPNIISSIEVDTLAISDARLALLKDGQKIVDMKGIEARMIKTKIDSNGISLRTVVEDGLFRFSVSSIDITPLHGAHQMNLNKVSYINSVQSLSVESFHLLPRGGSSGQDLISVHTKNIQIEKFNPEKFIYSKIIQCRSLKLNQMDIELVKIPGKKAEVAGTPKVQTTDIFSTASIDTFIISDSRFSLKDGNARVLDLSGIYTSLYNTKIDSKNISLENLVRENNYNIVVGNAKFTPVKGIHHMSISNIRYLNAIQSLSVGSFSVTPTIQSNNPSITGKKQQDIFTIACKNIFAEKFDPGQFIFHDFITAASVSLSVDLRVLTDKFHGDNTESRIGQYPHQMLQKLKIKVNIPTLKFQNSYVQYTEKKAGTGKTGTLFFSQLNGTVSNLSNTTNGSMKLVGDGMLMNTGKAHNEWNMPMGSNSGEFTIKGTIENFDLMKLNEVAMNLADAEILSGYLDRLTYTINGNNTGSTGEVGFAYHDLKLKILQANEDIKIKNIKLLSVLANIVVKNKNTDTKPKSFTNDRDPTKSFFNLMWKSIFAGIKKVAAITNQ